MISKVAGKSEKKKKSVKKENIDPVTGDIILLSQESVVSSSQERYIVL